MHEHDEVEEVTEGRPLHVDVAQFWIPFIGPPRVCDEINDIFAL